MGTRKANYIYITVAVAFTIFLGFLYNISYITTFYYSVAAHLHELFIVIPAIICAILFANNGSFWLTMLVLACIDAVGFRVYHNLGLADVTALLMIIVTFLITVFAVNLVKVLLRG